MSILKIHKDSLIYYHIMSTEVYKQIINKIVSVADIRIEANNTVLLIWNNDLHLNEWISGTNPTTSNVRIVTVDSSFFPDIKPSDEYNGEQLGIVAMGFSTMVDYSDFTVLFYVTVRPN